MTEGLTPQQELTVLRKYATGAELAAIVKELGFDHDAVTAVVSVVGYQRGRAVALLREREAALLASRKPPAAVVPRPVEKKPAPPEPLGIDDIVARAFEVGGVYAQRAERLRTMAVDLRNEITVLASAEKKVADLEAMLSDAKGQLRKLKRGTGASAAQAPKGAAA